MPRLSHTAAGLLAAAVIAAGARRAGALSNDGAVAATLVGGAAVGGTGLRGGAALVGFFVSSSLLGRLPRSTDVAPQRRGNRRDAVQVLANGGIAALLALAGSAVPAFRRECFVAAYGGAVAAAAADTWATEIGSRWGGAPRSLASLKVVAPGASGAVTVVGLAASLAGAMTIATILAQPPRTARPRRLAAIAVGGLAGSLADSVLGATIQEVRWCPVCDRETEAVTHWCGSPTEHRRGYPWCTNDTVNLLATACGALISAVIHANSRAAQTRTAMHGTRGSCPATGPREGTLLPSPTGEGLGMRASAASRQRPNLAYLPL